MSEPSDTSTLALRRCLSCRHEFPRNDELEWLPRGRRFAFDPARGRLWIICTWCAHWSLVPLDQRWEAIEELDRRAHEPGSAVLATTEHVSLLRVGPLQILRIGPAIMKEEAWWRFGSTLRGRQLRYHTVTRSGAAVAAAVATVGVLGVVLVMPEIALVRGRRLRRAPERAARVGADAAESFERWFRYGSEAWSGAAPCAACGRMLRSFRFNGDTGAFLQPDGTVHVRCEHCRRTRTGWHVLEGADAETLVRRVLAWQNIAGATEPQLSDAVDLVRSGSLSTGRRTEPLPLRHAPREQLLGLELLLSQQHEARVLGWELAALEAQWRAEETTASIIDGELTPLAKPAT